MEEFTGKSGGSLGLGLVKQLDAVTREHPSTRFACSGQAETRGKELEGASGRVGEGAKKTVQSPMSKVQWCNAVIRNS